MSSIDSSSNFLAAGACNSTTLSTPESSDLTSVTGVRVTEKLVLVCCWEWTGVKAESVASCENVGSVLAGDAKADGVNSFGEASAGVVKEWKPVLVGAAT